MEQLIFPDAERLRSKKIFFPRAAVGLSEDLFARDPDMPKLQVMHSSTAEQIPVERDLRMIVIGCQWDCKLCERLSAGRVSERSPIFMLRMRQAIREASTEHAS